tara:strand:+ start:664 stop:939 length:276 start_codon:yes stop_codon:yes gene_type:complete
MDKKILNYYDNRFSMMSSPGWKDLMEDLQKMYDEYKSVQNCETSEDFHFAKGQVDILKYMLGLKDMSEKVYEDLCQEEEAHPNEDLMYVNT